MLSRVKKLFVFTFFICLLSAFAACNRQKENFLPPENIRVENDYLLWDATPHTEWYLVDIDGTEYEADTNSLNLRRGKNLPDTNQKRRRRNVQLSEIGLVSSVRIQIRSIPSSRSRI